MNLPRYEYVTESAAEFFKFTSEGIKGNIKKLVVYTQTLESNIYNLAFGDYNEDNDSINDEVITDNKDMQKVLATVASTLYIFADKHPNTWVYATGISEARTRLYRIGITTNLEEILQDFEVYGLNGQTWKAFKKGEEYQAFLVKRKST